MLRLLVNTIAKEFYQQHAGYFLMGFYILFGVVEPSQLIGYHKALLLAGISSPIGMVFVFISWCIYSIKVHFFIKQRLTSATYNFIKEVGTLDRNSQLKLWLALHCVILSPIIIYVFALIVLSVYHHFFFSLLYLVTIFSALVFGLAFHSYQSITFGFLKQERKQSNFGIILKRPFLSWPLHYLWNEQSLMLLMCKVLSLVFFKGMLWMFADVGNDTRVLLVALLASVLCHAVLIFTLLKFEIAYLNFSKSLPISTYKRLLGWLSTFTIILLPEWLFLIVSSDYNIHSIINGFLFSLAGLLFLLTLLYILKLNMERYLRWLLFFFFLAMWSVLAHYYLVFSLVLLGGCALYYVFVFSRTDLSVDES